MFYNRVTTKSVSESVILSMMNNRTKMAELQEQISTGKRIDTPSDDASAAIDVLTSNTALAKIEIYKENVNTAKSELDFVDNQMQSITDNLHRVKELTTQAANASCGPEELKNINEEIEQIIESLKSIGNTKFGNNYVFAGVNNAIPPFESTTTGEIDYVGTPKSGDYQRKIEVSDNVLVDINVTGEEILGYHRIVPGAPPTVDGKGLFNTLVTLSQELKTDPPSHDNIRSKLGELDDALSSVSMARARLGGVSNRLETTLTRLEDDKVNFSEFKKNAEGIDMIKAMSDLQFQEVALNASLSVGSKLIKTSLINYL